MHRYEVLILTVPEITADEAKNLEQHFDRLVAQHGSMVSFERWGKYRLAYPIKNNDYGIYYLVRFEVAEPEPLLGHLQVLLGVKLHEVIMRFIVHALAAKQSLVYQRPQSLEEAPAREAGSFIKERVEHNGSHEDMDAQEL